MIFSGGNRLAFSLTVAIANYKWHAWKDRAHAGASPFHFLQRLAEEVKAFATWLYSLST